MEGHAFTNIQNSLVEVEDIPEEVEKKAYDDIFLDEIILGASVLCQLSLNLIDLPLTHPELIDWDQPSVVHVDEFSTEHALLKFMGAETPHKQPPPPSAYVYKLDPVGYFGEEEISSRKIEMKKEIKKQKGKRKTSFGENSSRAPWDASKNERKIKDVSDGENLSKAPEDGDFILPPQENRPPISSVLTEETTPDINTWLYKEPPPKSEELLDHFKQKYP